MLLTDLIFVWIVAKINFLLTRISIHTPLHIMTSPNKEAAAKAMSKMTIDDTVKDTKMMEEDIPFDSDDDDSMCEPYSPEKPETTTNKVDVNTSLLLTKVATRTTLSKEEARHLEVVTETQEWQAAAKKESIDFNAVDIRKPRK